MNTCKVCNSNLEEGEIFCSNCGAKKVETPEFTYESQETSGNAEAGSEYTFISSSKAVSETKKKKKPTGKIAAAVIAALLVVVAGGILVFANPFSKKSAAANPDDYLKNVLKKEVEQSIKDISSLNVQKSDKNTDYAYNLNIDLEVGDMITSLLTTSGITLNNIAADISCVKQGDDSSVSLALSSDKENIITLEAIYNMLSESLYARLPELSSSYLKFNISDIAKELYNSMSYDITSIDFTSEINNYLSKMPTEKELEELALKYTDAFLTILDDNTEFEKNVSVTVGKLTNEYDKFTTVVNNEKIIEVTCLLLETLKEDDIFGKLIEDELHNQGTSLSALIKEVKNSKDTIGNASFQLDFYLDKKDNVKGFELILKDEYTNYSLGYNSVSKDDKTSSYAWVKDDGEELFSFTNNYTEKNNEKNGELVVSVSEYDYNYEEYNTTNFKAEYSNLKSDKEKNILQGTLIFSTSALPVGNLTLDFNCNNKKSDVTIDLGYMGQSFAKLNISLEEDSDAKLIKVDQNQTVYDILEDESLADKYLNEINIQEFLNDVMSKLGLDPSLLYGLY